jgi:cyclic pyranopterin phosphate synthase
MDDNVQFLPKADTLSLEEIEYLCRIFVRLGITKLRLTGGEPLIRRGVMKLIANLGTEVTAGRLKELTLTTNGMRLAEFSEGLKAAGVKRINVSLDSLDPATFRCVSKIGQLEKVLDGIKVAKNAGLKIKVNTVVLKGINDHEIDNIIIWCGEEGHQLSLIEVMPLGGGRGGDYNSHYLPLDLIQERLRRRWTLEPSPYSSGGPAIYYRVAETAGFLGFIAPLTHNFCGKCNRVRVTCTGQIYSCLGREDKTNLRDALRGGQDHKVVETAILRAVAGKQKGHDFIAHCENGQPAIFRSMNVTGG